MVYKRYYNFFLDTRLLITIVLRYLNNRKNLWRNGRTNELVSWRSQRTFSCIGKWWYLYTRSGFGWNISALLRTAWWRLISIKALRGAIHSWIKPLLWYCYLYCSNIRLCRLYPGYYWCKKSDQISALPAALLNSRGSFS